jgi:hypothetical protein
MGWLAPFDRRNGKLDTRRSSSTLPPRYATHHYGARRPFETRVVCLNNPLLGFSCSLVGSRGVLVVEWGLHIIDIFPSGRRVDRPFLERRRGFFFHRFRRLHDMFSLTFHFPKTFRSSCGGCDHQQAAETYDKYERGEKQLFHKPLRAHHRATLRTREGRRRALPGPPMSRIFKILAHSGPTWVAEVGMRPLSHIQPEDSHGADEYSQAHRQHGPQVWTLSCDDSPEGLLLFLPNVRTLGRGTRVVRTEIARRACPGVLFGTTGRMIKPTAGSPAQAQPAGVSRAGSGQIPRPQPHWIDSAPP